MNPEKTALVCALEYADARTESQHMEAIGLMHAHRVGRENAAEVALRIITEDYRNVTALNARLQVQLTALLEELPVEEREKIRKI